MLNEMKKIINRKFKYKLNMQVSGWDAEDEDIEEEKHPHATPEKEILWAAENGKIDIICGLLKINPKLVDVSDKDGYTPLHRACYSGHLDAVSVLLEFGAKVNAKTEMGWQPLHSACKWNHARCAARLLQYGADVNARTEGDQTPLHIAATHSHCKEIAQLLLVQPNIKTDIVNKSNETALQIAARCCKYFSIFELADKSLSHIEK